MPDIAAVHALRILALAASFLLFSFAVSERLRQQQEAANLAVKRSELQLQDLDHDVDVLARRFALQYPNWFFYEMMSALKLIVKVALFEPQRATKLWNTARGTWDGLRMAARDKGVRA